MSHAAANQESNSEPIANDLREAAQAFFPELSEIAPVSGHPDLARVTAPSGGWRVRRWPEGVPESDASFSHEVMRLARGAGLEIVPTLATLPDTPAAAWQRLYGRLFDAQRWITGAVPANAEFAWPQPDQCIDAPVVLPAELFSSVIRSVAHLHGATTALAATSGIPDAPLQLLPGAVRQAQARQLGSLRAKARHEPSVQRWLATGERLIAAAEPLLLAATEQHETPRSVLHLGLWPAHVLIDDGQVSGLLGWERVAAGSPLLDLAQAILRLQGWTEEAVELALGDYGEIRELSPEDRRLLPAVAALDAVATTGRLLEQTYANVESARPPTPLRGAIDRLLRSMTALDRNLNAPTEKSRRRVWNRQMPRPAPRPKGERSRGRHR